MGKPVPIATEKRGEQPVQAFPQRHGPMQGTAKLAAGETRVVQLLDHILTGIRLERTPAWIPLVCGWLGWFELAWIVECGRLVD